MDHGVSLSVSGGVATILLDRPVRRNALGLETWLALTQLVEAADGDPAIDAIVLRGAGGTFGAGNDISEFGALHGDPTAAMTFARAMADAMRAVEMATKPVIVAIEGCCYGASVALALAGDLRFAADDAMFAITPAKLGALYLQSDLHRLVAAVGAGQARRMIYTAEPVDATRALAIGLVDEVVPVDGFEAALARLTGIIRRGSPFTLRRSKVMLREVGHGTPLETEASLGEFVVATQGDDFREGIEAFLNKRQPRFR
ncbi:enoyl-CoA hydratase-related protein [Sphingomonas sp. MG17]|uniref:Enoyl-CoA hydratase-related protein n=1 Tax=Sphingomonas tagetis TaxID=2949092 RepID=A0A9X2HHE9_9SPHN|nr:enoyl-CoA hydratase-related protein [Sphingomonas tagetis]MCP3729992.1 enoyl-CoA hydratase-related protein [Sphingomonas tagetis]